MKVLKMENYVVAVSECRMVGGTEQWMVENLAKTKD